jgi:hypothetical protein
MKLNLPKMIKTIISDIRQSIVGIILGAVILGAGGIFLFAKKLWRLMLLTMQSPTPLWATTALVLLLVLYIYIKISKPHSFLLPKIKMFFVNTHIFKWKVTTYSNNTYKIDDIPFCIEHDLQLVADLDKYQCPYFNNKSCKNSLKENERKVLYKVAISLAENKTRNNSLPC